MLLLITIFPIKIERFGWSHTHTQRVELMWMHSGSIFLVYSCKSICNLIKCKKLISNSIIKAWHSMVYCTHIVSVHYWYQLKKSINFFSLFFFQKRIMRLTKCVWLSCLFVEHIVDVCVSDHSLFIWNNLSRSIQKWKKNETFTHARPRPRPMAFQHSTDHSDQFNTNALSDIYICFLCITTAVGCFIWIG